jgi:hypothetical protein
MRESMMNIATHACHSGRLKAICTRRTRHGSLLGNYIVFRSFPMFSVDFLVHVFLNIRKVFVVTVAGWHGDSSSLVWIFGFEVHRCVPRRLLTGIRQTRTNQTIPVCSHHFPELACPTSWRSVMTVYLPSVSKYDAKPFQAQNLSCENACARVACFPSCGSQCCHRDLWNLTYVSSTCHPSLRDMNR